MQYAQMTFRPNTVLDLKVRAEDLPALMKALGTLTIAEGEVLHTMVKAQLNAAAMASKAAETPAKPPQASPDQNTTAKTAES